jgi:hypothetical protein
MCIGCILENKGNEQNLVSIPEVSGYRGLADL